jgi:diacylglycerol kinase (ATP)
MKAILLHNPSAGEAPAQVDRLLDGLRHAGYEAEHVSSKDKDSVKKLKKLGDLVVVAGGDGTVRKAALKLDGTGIPIYVLPMGTANNIARSLGVQGAPDELIERLPSARRMSVDVGKARGTWGKKRFIEGVGTGFFARVMGFLDALDEEGLAHTDDTRERLRRDLQILRDALPTYPVHPLVVQIDGHEWTGEALMWEAMNVRSVGPNLMLAPDAAMDDGLLDFVVVMEDQRELFGDYLSALLEGLREPPVLSRTPCKHIRARWDGTELHIDDKIRRDPDDDDEGEEDGDGAARIKIEVKVKPGAVEFLVPSP